MMATPLFRRGSRRPGSAQRGFSLVAAIVILVVLTTLGAYIVSISAVQHRTLALDVLGARAYQAARAGIEWSARQIYLPEGTATTPYSGAAPFECVAPVTTNITGLSGELGAFTVTAICSMNSYTESGNTIRVFQVVANACNDPGGGTCPNHSSQPAYVERQITAVFATCRLSGGAPC